MAKKKSFYNDIMKIIKKEFPDLEHNEVQKFSSRINNYIHSFYDGDPGNLEAHVKSYVGSEVNSSSKKSY